MLRLPRGPAGRCAGALVLFVAQGACTSPPVQPSVQPAAETSASALAAEPGDPDGADLSRLAPDVRACLSANALELARGKAIYEVSRADGALGTLVSLAIADPSDRTGDIKPSLLLFKPDRSCVSMLDYGGVFYSVEQGTPDDVQPALEAAFSQWTTDWRAGR